MHVLVHEPLEQRGIVVGLGLATWQILRCNLLGAASYSRASNSMSRIRMNC